MAAASFLNAFELLVFILLVLAGILILVYAIYRWQLRKKPKKQRRRQTVGARELTLLEKEKQALTR